MCLSHVHFLLEVEPICDLEIPLDSPLVTEIKIPLIPTTHKLTQCQIQTPTTGELEFEINIAQQASKYFLCIYFLLPKGSNEIVVYFRSIEQQNRRARTSKTTCRSTGISCSLLVSSTLFCCALTSPQPSFYATCTNHRLQQLRLER